MQKRDYYGSEPLIELLDQLIEYDGLNERPSLNENDIRNISIIGAGDPDGGERNPLTS
jgi:hypothetical protein